MPYSLIFLPVTAFSYELVTPTHVYGWTGGRRRFLRKANTDPAPRKGIFLKPTSRTENITSSSSEAAHSHQSNTNSNFVNIGLNIWPKCTPMMDDTFLVEVRFRLPAISTKLTGVHMGAEGGWSKTYTWAVPSSREGAQIDASRSTDLLEFYSEIGTRIALKNGLSWGRYFLAILCR